MTQTINSQHFKIILANCASTKIFFLPFTFNYPHKGRFIPQEGKDPPEETNPALQKQ